MGFWEAVGGALGGAAGWVRDRVEDAGDVIGDVATGVSSAVLGKEVKKFDEKKRRMVTTRQGGFVQAAEGGVKKVQRAIGGAQEHLEKQQQRYG
ncbi:MAG: hypothetical protein ACOC80_12050, partial [Petrotogales bacterium]